jgi:acetyl-CoA acetyltransferase
VTFVKSRAVIIGYGETPVSRGKKERGEEQLTLEEYLAWGAKLALENAGLKKDDVDGQGLVVNGAQYPHSELWSCEVAQNLGLSPKRLVRVDNGGESAISSLGRACDLINSGAVDLVLCVSGDAPLSVVSHPYPYFGEPYVYSRDYEDVYGMQGPKAIFGFIMRKHMELYGTTAEQTGKIAVVSRSHALLNPIAYFKEPITLEDYLKSPLLADPIRLLDNVMLVNGAHAFIVASSEVGKKYTDNPVHVLGTGEVYNYYASSRNRPNVTTTGISQASKEAFSQSELSPNDIDCFQPYDDFPIAVVMQLEDSGFCKKGEGGKFVEKTDLSIKGELPLSTGGGQLSSGQPGLSGGHVPFVECIRQMKGDGGQRQVNGARIGLAAGIGGLSYIRNLENTGVAILGSRDSLR